MTAGFIPNLHVVIDGVTAGTYIPFAKTMVRRLMATGMYAAEESSLTDDGFDISAKIIGDQRYIRIASGTIYLESGCVDFTTIGLLDPHIYDEGILYFGDKENAYKKYNGLLSLGGDPSVPESSYLKNKQVSLAYGMPKKPDGSRDSSRDSLLVDKKLTTMFVPASMYTGKMRLYVQSLYGQKLTEWIFTMGTAEDGAVLPGHLIYETPDVTLGEGRAAPITFTMNTGIYSDSEGNYWLIELDFGTVRKLDMPRIAVVLRNYIQSHADLKDDVKDKLEAYVLSVCRPSATFYFHITHPISYYEAMGYGWKFNWDGTFADIVTTDLVTPDNFTSYNISNHYRMSFVRDASKKDTTTTSGMTDAEKLAHDISFEKSRWTIDQAHVEGPTKWKNSYVYSTIAYPSWFSNELVKWGSKWGDIGGSGAPFYCLYRRNKLAVFRFSYSLGTVDARRKSSPSYFQVPFLNLTSGKK